MAFKYLGSFVQNDVSQDKELNRRIGLATMTFGKLKSMVQRSGPYSTHLVQAQLLLQAQPLLACQHGR